MLLTKTAKQNHHQQKIIQNPLNGMWRSKMENLQIHILRALY